MIYLLLIFLNKSREINVGSLGEIYFKKGYYVYVGSAPNWARIRRHLRKEKKIFWHIDYFLKYAEIKEVFFINKNKEWEDKVAFYLKNFFVDVPRFGASDSKTSHLFFVDKNLFYSVIRKLNFMKIDLNIYK